MHVLVQKLTELWNGDEKAEGRGLVMALAKLYLLVGT